MLSGEEFIPVGVSMSRWFSESVSLGQEHLAEAVDNGTEGVNDPGAKDIAQVVNLRSQWII